MNDDGNKSNTGDNWDFEGSACCGLVVSVIMIWSTKLSVVAKRMSSALYIHPEFYVSNLHWYLILLPMVAQIPRVIIWGGDILLTPPNICAPIPPGGWGYLVGPLRCTYIMLHIIISMHVRSCQYN